jgi:hypothetical protein
MGERSVFLQSALGSRIRSPLGAFVGHRVSFLEIFSVPTFVINGGSYNITGDSFEATQGAGSVYISQFPVFDIDAVEQTVVSWSDNLIVFTANFAGSIADTGVFWIHVFNNSGLTDFAATTAQTIASAASFVNGTISMGTGETICGFSAGSYRRLQTGILYNALPNAGYLRRGSAGRTFFHESEGFTLIGATSGKTVEYGAVSTAPIYPNGSTFYRSNQYCGVEGLFSFYRDDLGPAVGITPANVFTIAYSTTLNSDTFGWVSGETLHLVPKNPLSVQITTPQPLPLRGYPNPSYPPGATITLTAYAYDKTGSRDSSIEWFNDTTPIGSGASISYALPGTTGVSEIYAQAETAYGMARVMRVDVIRSPLDLDSIFPYGGPNAGGTVVYLYGLSFTNTCTVEFDGVAATSVTLLTTNCIRCVAPAGTGSVDVTVLDGATSSTRAGAFTYSAAGDITISSVSPNTGPSAGGTTCTMTGTGFTADCVVRRGHEISGPLGTQSNFAFVSSTSITFDTSSTGTNKGPFAFFVHDTVTGAGAVLPEAFIYT